MHKLSDLQWTTATLLHGFGNYNDGREHFKNTEEALRKGTFLNRISSIDIFVFADQDKNDIWIRM